MSVLNIVKEPIASLRVPSKNIDASFLALAETRIFIADLIETMYDDDGIGIASPQVGSNFQICIIGKEAVPGKKKDLVLVNPTFERTSKKTETDTEGCLSVPNVYGKVKRYKDITVKALDENGEVLLFSAKNFFARVIQHEVDHLNGILFINRATDMYEVPPEDPNYKRPKI